MSRTSSAADSKWRSILGRQRASGLGVAAFCRRHGLSAASLYAWRRRLSGAAPAFVEAKVVEPARAPESAGIIEVCLRGGRRVRVGRGFDPDLLRELVAALEGLPPTAEGLP